MTGRYFNLKNFNRCKTKTFISSITFWGSITENKREVNEILELVIRPKILPNSS